MARSRSRASRSRRRATRARRPSIVQRRARRSRRRSNRRGRKTKMHLDDQTGERERMGWDDQPEEELPGSTTTDFETGHLIQPARAPARKAAGLKAVKKVAAKAEAADKECIITHLIHFRQGFVNFHQFSRFIQLHSEIRRFFKAVQMLYFSKWAS